MILFLQGFFTLALVGLAVVTVAAGLAICWTLRID